MILTYLSDNKMLRLLTLFCAVFRLEAARILFVIPTPSISHQLPMRPLTQELAKRGHDVVVITTDPIYPKGGAPANFTEIDLHDLSYTMWRKKVLNASRGNANDLEKQLYLISLLKIDIFEKQMKIKEVANLLNDKTQKFDLLFIECASRPSLMFSHVFKAPVILISSFLHYYNILQIMGSDVHYFLYPEILQQKINNITKWEKLMELRQQYKYVKLIDNLEEWQEASMRRILGPDVPPLKKLYNNVDMLFLNAHRIWDSNRPVPPSVVYLGGIHKVPERDLPKDLKSYLDSSKNGIIYISFGTNVSPSALPAEKIQLLAKVFSKLPYNVLWKWDKDELPGKPDNVKISKWLPQSDLLRHPKLKAFITQGGLQSTDEAIDAGVPLIGIPLLGDQWFNVENYVKHGIGLRLNMNTLTEEKFRNAIEKVINDPSYRQNIIEFRELINDQPQSPLERAVWWTEHILRHGGGRHLRSPAANLPWTEYYEVELVSYALLAVLLVLALISTVIIYSVLYLLQIVKTRRKLKTN